MVVVLQVPIATDEAAGWPTGLSIYLIVVLTILVSELLTGLSENETFWAFFEHCDLV